MEKILYLMRHGQTLFNVQHKIQGWCDAPLTELGIKQAQLAGEYFIKNHITFDHAYSSTSERACDTLEYATRFQVPYVRVKGLKEWNFGVFEGKDECLNPKLPYGDFFKPFGGEGGCPGHWRRSWRGRTTGWCWPSPTGRPAGSLPASGSPTTR